ncbi:hypothetical protein [Mesorhizobium sp.]|uniref:DUF6894 family protein n=1 Tax=Mesorhizobium sp. TaxID=1871066 RepID=UPI000FE6E83E|nr:hypothetical protein [Mesorhizobium sp.]RWB65439.1 MAG: hypothetical protein EOQ49_32075 [Mesorhizobium sp.]RWB89225.1 MAG: hypothetical protein EOQ52_12685 [Mesorhizobium sp.]
MPRFFFDVSEKSEVYHDAQGIILPSFGAAKDRALAIVRKLETIPHADDDLVCTVRDVGGHQLLQIRIQAGKPVVSLEN